MAEEAHELENAEELRLGSVFDARTAQPLSNSEALQLLNQVHATRKALNSDYVPTPMVKQATQYLERFNNLKSEQAAGAMKQTLMEAEVHPFEQCMLINLMPTGAEEAKSLVPSLENIGERFPDDELLQTILDRMGTYKDLS